MDNSGCYMVAYIYIYSRILLDPIPDFHRFPAATPCTKSLRHAAGAVAQRGVVHRDALAVCGGGEAPSIATAQPGKVEVISQVTIVRVRS